MKKKLNIRLTKSEDFPGELELWEVTNTPVPQDYNAKTYFKIGYARPSDFAESAQLDTLPEWVCTMTIEEAYRVSQFVFPPSIYGGSLTHDKVYYRQVQPRPNQVDGIIMRPCSETAEQNKAVMRGTEFFVERAFLSEYRKHVAACQIVAESAKIYISENWRNVGDWSKLNVVMWKTGLRERVEFYNHVRDEAALDLAEGDGRTLSVMRRKIELEDRLRHNPLASVTDVTLDPSDGDCWMCANGEWCKLDDAGAVIVAEYIELSDLPF